ncbi:MAG TPA: general secretion pathway protein GspB [Steroidobacteraceae bacterium]|nr:general secretion pathway protein GspB [Steroidobacteraceae bacterium]
MSFILDALKKSEHARERRALPGLVDAPVARAGASRLPWILGGVGALLVVNIGVLLWVLARPPPPSPAAPPPARSAEAPPAPSPRPVMAKVRPLSAETEAGADPELERQEPQPPPASLPRAEPYAAEKAAAAREFAQPRVTVAGLPSIHQLPAQATAGLPALNLDLHVYSNEPAQRFVIINGQRLHEGDTLKEGPAVERITPDGAILNHQGTRFLLPRE